MKQPSPIKFFSKLKWIDERALTDVIESYRRDIFERALYAFDGERPKYNLVLTGRAKKNWKSADLILAALYRLLAWKSPGGNQCYGLANDLDQADDNLELAKKIVEINPPIKDFVTVKQNLIERKDGKGFFEILPAGDVVGKGIGYEIRQAGLGCDDRGPFDRSSRLSVGIRTHWNYNGDDDDD
jgi:hypothetical protein